MSGILLALCVVLLSLTQISEQADSRLPRLRYTYSHQKALLNVPYQLDCKAEDSTPITFFWNFNNTQIDPEIHNRYSIITSKKSGYVVSILSITSTERSDSGTFTCIATNSFGNDSVDINLLVQEPPEAPYNLKVLTNSNNTLELSWDKPYDGNSPIIYYEVEYKLSNLLWENRLKCFSHEPRCQMNVRDATSYHIRVMAVNGMGSSEPSEILSVFTAKEVPDVPTDIRVQRQDEHSLVVFWKPPLKDHWNVTVSGYYVGFRFARSNEPYVFLTVETQEKNEEYRLEIPNLKTYTQYSVVVRAFNKLGEGNLSDEIKIYTGEGVPQAAPKNPMCSPNFQSILFSWKPITTCTNGVIIGYKVIFGPSKTWLDEDTRVEKVTNINHTLFLNLQKNTNYTMQVLALTSKGGGPATKPIKCQTPEHVPEAPASIKAVVRSSDSIFVVWKPPLEPNGDIVHYTVYHKEGDDDPVSYTVTPDLNLRFLVERLNSSLKHVFWVTAATAVGEGQPSEKVTLSPSSTVPAQIITFGSVFTVDYGENVVLPCPAVGRLRPIWKVKGVKLSQNNYSKQQTDGSLFIRHVRREDAGEYSCHVDNEHGQDSITHHLVVNGSPRGPHVEVVSSTADSVTLRLKPHQSDVETVRKYVIHYKPTSGDWKRIDIPAPKQSYGKCTLQELRCGTRYLIYVEAYNSFGKGDPSEMLSTKTRGHKPVAPTAETFVEASCYSIILHFNTWSDGGCPISNFTIKHKNKRSSEWIQQSFDVNLDGKFVLLDLEPAVAYELQVTAWNEAGFKKYSAVVFTEGDSNESESSVYNAS